MSWLQPSVVRLDVIVKENNTFKAIATNILEDVPLDFSTLVFDEVPRSELKRDASRGFGKSFIP